MDDAGGVRGTEGVGEERADTRGELGEHRPLLLDLAEQRVPADQFHHDVRRRLAFASAHVEDLEDVRVVEAGRRARLAMEAPHDLGPAREVMEHDLHRDVAPQLAIARAEHARHPALAHFVDQLVAPEHVARAHGADLHGGGRRGGAAFVRFPRIGQGIGVVVARH